MADLANASRGSIARYESGEAGFDSKSIADLAAALGVSELELFSDPTVHEYKALADRLIQASTEAAFKAGLEQGRKSVQPPSDPLLARVAKLSPEQRRMLENALRNIEDASLDEEVEEKPAKQTKKS